MHVTRKHVIGAIASSACVIGLLQSQGSLFGGLSLVHADTNFNCTGTLSVNPSSGTFSTYANPTTLTLHATGLDKEKQVFLQLYDANGRAASLIPVTKANVDTNGVYDGQVQLPSSGVAGGDAQIVVADYGPSCARASFTLNPTVLLNSNQNYSLTFSGVGFHSGSTVSIKYTDSAGKTFNLGSVSATALGVANELGLMLPGDVAKGAGTLSFDDAQGGVVSNVAFTFIGLPPTPTPCAGPCPTATVTQTFVPAPVITPGGAFPGAPGTGGGTGSLPTAPPGSNATSTNTPIVSATVTSTPPATNIAVITSTPTTGFPVSTPPRIVPSITPTAGFPKQTPVTTPVAKSPCSVPAGSLANGDFSQGTQCWTVGTKNTVTIQKASGTKKPAALISSKTDDVVFSQNITANGKTKSITFSYLNKAKSGIVQLLDNGRVVVGRRLLAPKGTTPTAAVLPVPASTSTGRVLSLSFMVKQGVLTLQTVGTDTSPTGPAAKPATPVKK